MITDELRAWARDSTVQGEVLTTLPAQHPIRGTLESLVSIADRIDEMNESMVGCTADEWDYWESTHIELPKDADGEPIHVGDKVVVVDELAVPRTVTSINLAGDGWWVYINGVGRRSDKYLHYHAPTIEDVLDEIVDKANSIGCAYANNDISGEEMMGALQEIVAEYADKLRLAEGDE